MSVPITKISLILGTLFCTQDFTRFGYTRFKYNMRDGLHSHRTQFSPFYTAPPYRHFARV